MELLKLKIIFNIIFFGDSFLFLIKIINITNEKKKMIGSHIRHSIGNTKNMYIRGIFLEYLILDKIKNIINPTNINTSFRAKTSISATGYKRNIGESIAIIVKLFFGTSFINK